jgi:hypothetical protein
MPQASSVAAAQRSAAAAPAHLLAQHAVEHKGHGLAHGVEQRDDDLRSGVAAAPVVADAAAELTAVAVAAVVGRANAGVAGGNDCLNAGSSTNARDAAHHWAQHLRIGRPNFQISHLKVCSWAQTGSGPAAQTKTYRPTRNFKFNSLAHIIPLLLRTDAP